ncbi:MAG: hypothetical protein A2Y25_09825 [Candidatus Melainabacteria bacterium GWF2_37_15]|nr:MAG: hypothetical protein A2Y25_09825 [Candidatus Melainabacteria bacterium GWF2_37_15]
MNNIDQNLVNRVQQNPNNQTSTNTTQETPNKQEDPTKQLKYIAAGAGAYWGIGKGVDAFVLSGNSDPNRSILGRLVQKIDNWSNKSGIMQFLSKKAAYIKGKITGTHTNLLKNPNYNEITQSLKKGSQTKSMLTREPLRKQLFNQIDEIRKTQLKEVTGARHNLRLLQENNLVEKLQKRIVSGRGQNLTKRVLKSSNKRIKALLKENVSIGTLKENLQKILPNYNLSKTVSNKLKNPNNVDEAINIIKNSSLYEKKAKDVITKIKMIDHVNKNSSFLSRLLTKFSIGTGDFMGNNPMSFILNGLVLGDSIKSTIEAPKGEKFSTFMEDIMGNWFGGILMFPYVGKVVSAIAGLKNIGSNMTETPLWRKGLQLVGKVVGMGQGKSLIKSLPGGILRFALTLALLSQVSKMFKNVSHNLFGKPMHKYKEKTEENTQNTTSNNQNMTSNVQNTQNLTSNNQNMADNTQNNINDNKIGNLFERARSSASQKKPASQQENTQSYNYLPSPMPAKFEEKSSTPKGLDMKLKKAEEAEKQAIEILGKK